VRIPAPEFVMTGEAKARAARLRRWMGVVPAAAVMRVEAGVTGGRGALRVYGASTVSPLADIACASSPSLVTHDADIAEPAGARTRGSLIRQVRERAGKVTSEFTIRGVLGGL